QKTNPSEPRAPATGSPLVRNFPPPPHYLHSVPQTHIAPAEKKPMSRFSRSVGTQFLTWSPAGTALRIEYASSLFREARLEPAAGILFGLRTATSLRVVAARATPDPHDPRLAGLE